MKVLLIHDHESKGMQIQLCACKCIHAVKVANGYYTFRLAVTEGGYDAVIIQNTKTLTTNSPAVVRLVKKYNPEARIWVVGYEYVEEDLQDKILAAGVDEVIYYYNVYDRLKQLPV